MGQEGMECAVWPRKLFKAVDKAGLQAAVIVKETDTMKKNPGTLHWESRARAHSPKAATYEDANSSERKVTELRMGLKGFPAPK